MLWPSSGESWTLMLHAQYTYWSSMQHQSQIFSRKWSEQTEWNVELMKPTVLFRTTPTHLEIIITWCYRKPVYIVFPPFKVSNPTDDPQSNKPFLTHKSCLYDPYRYGLKQSYLNLVTLNTFTILQGLHKRSLYQALHTCRLEMNRQKMKVSRLCVCFILTHNKLALFSYSLP